MKIEHVEHDIAESLANVPTLELPAELHGLRHLPLTDHSPRVIIRQPNGRKVRRDADASYFDPACSLLIEFVPAGIASEEENPGEPDNLSGNPETDATPAAMVEALRQAEPHRPFVGLTWFRDKVLPESGYRWAKDPVTIHGLLRAAIEQGLILTSRVANPKEPSRPVTAIRVNRTHPHFRPDAPRQRSRFRPIPMRGGPIATTVLEDRR